MLQGIEIALSALSLLISSFICSHKSSFLLEITTFAPWLENCFAIASPIPLVDPVTRALFPDRSNKSIISSFL